MTNFPDTNNNSTAPDPSKGWVAGDKFTTDEGVVYTWTGYSWTTEGSGGGGGDYLPLTGGELTGPLTSTSSITAAGDVTFTPSTNASGIGSQIIWTTEAPFLDVVANINAERASTGNAATSLTFNTGGGAAGPVSEALRLDADGSITAAGVLTVNSQAQIYNPKTDNTAALLKLNSDVNGTNTRQVTIRANGDILTEGAINSSSGNSSFGGEIYVNSSISAAGNVAISDHYSSDGGLTLDKLGLVYIRPKDSLSDSTEALVLYNGGTESSNKVFTVSASGSINAAGVVSAGNRLVANADGVKSGSDNTFISYNELASVTASIAADGSASFAGGDLQIANDGTLLLNTNNGGSGGIACSNTISLDGLTGSAAFKGNVESGFNDGQANGVQLVSTGYFNIRNDSSVSACFSIYSGGTTENNKACGIKSNGDATFTDLDNQKVKLNPSGEGIGIGVYDSFDNTQISLGYNGAATFVGTVTSANSFAIQLEADDPTKYDVTTEEYEETIRVPVVGGVGTADLVDGEPERFEEKTVTRTREVRTYSGAVLDVKEELQALRTRAAQQDETIALMTEALRVMGADVSPFTSNK